MYALIKITNSKSNVCQENFEITWPVNARRRQFQVLQSSSYTTCNTRTREHTRINEPIPNFFLPSKRQSFQRTRTKKAKTRAATCSDWSRANLRQDPMSNPLQRRRIENRASAEFRIYEKQKIRSRCAHSTRTSESSPLRRVGPVFSSGWNAKHLHQGTSRITRTDNTTLHGELNTSASRKNLFSHVAATAAECWLVLMVVPVLLLHTAYIPHDEHGHARSSLRERNAGDDSGSRGLFDACPFGRYFCRRCVSSVRKKARKNCCQPVLNTTIINNKEEDKNTGLHLRGYFTPAEITVRRNKISTVKVPTRY